MVPEDGLYRPASNFSNVLLPQPEGPTIATSRPLGIRIFSIEKTSLPWSEYLNATDFTWIAHGPTWLLSRWRPGRNVSSVAVMPSISISADDFLVKIADICRTA